jgi:hypothetical protein
MFEKGIQKKKPKQCMYEERKKGALKDETF